MYCTHKPDEGHKEWHAKKQERNAQNKENHGKRDRDTSTPAPHPAPAESNKKKLALSDSIQSALTTQLGMTPDHWKSVLEEACKESGN